MKILAVGGGSGGHVTPVVAVLNELQRLHGDQPLDVRFVCDASFESQSRTIMEAASMHVRIAVISAGKFRRYKHFRPIDYLTTPSVLVANTVDIFKVIAGFLQSFAMLVWNRPDVVFAKGGYVCLPMGLAARILSIPLVIHDSDARPGLTNRVLARFATTIATGYPLDNYTYPLQKSHYVGVPVRPEFTVVGEDKQRLYKEKFGFDASLPLVVAFGGGLGAVSINQAMLTAAPVLRSHNINAFVVAGMKQIDSYLPQVSEFSPNIKTAGFLNDDLVELLAAADIVITRASATSLQELAGLRKAIIAVPAKALSDQHKNAAVYKEAKAAIIMSDEELAAGKLTEGILDLVKDSMKRTRLAERLHEFAKPDAATVVATLVQTAAKR